MDLIERAAKEAKEKALAKAQEKARQENEKAAKEAGEDSSSGDDLRARFKSIGKKSKKPVESVSNNQEAAESINSKLGDPVETRLTKGIRKLSKSNADPKADTNEVLKKKGLRGLGSKKPKDDENTSSKSVQAGFKPDPTDLRHSAALAQGKKPVSGLTSKKNEKKETKSFDDALVRRAELEGTAFKPPISRLLKDKQAAEEKEVKPVEPKAKGNEKKLKNQSKFSEIDLTLLREKGFITPDMPTNMMAEEFRIIKRTLLLNAFGTEGQKLDYGNVIMVTSSNPNEGKTFCAINLALSIATEQDTTVLLIDADFNKPEILNRLGMRGGKGFMDVVADENLSIADCLLRTNVDNLVIMPAGRQHNRTTELLASERMKNIVQELSTRYPDRLIIFDAPPSLASSVPSVMSMYVGQTVYVIAAEETSEIMIKEGLTLVNKCKNINLLLNKTKMGSSNKKFATYYGYGRR